MLQRKLVITTCCSLYEIIDPRALTRARPRIHLAPLSLDHTSRAARMLLLATLLGIGAISQASPVHEAASTGHILLQRPTSSPPPACASFHGRLPTKSRTRLYYASLDCATTSGARGIPFDWSNGRLLWVGDTALDEEVAELVARRDQLQAARAMQQQQQQVLGVEQGWHVLTELGGSEGELIQIEDDEILRSWTQSEEWALKEMVAISEGPLPAPLSSEKALGADGPTVPSRDVQRIQDHLDELKFSPLVSNKPLLVILKLTPSPYRSPPSSRPSARRTLSPTSATSRRRINRLLSAMMSAGSLDTPCRRERSRPATGFFVSRLGLAGFDPR